MFDIPPFTIESVKNKTTIRIKYNIPLFIYKAYKTTLNEKMLNVLIQLTH